MDIFNSTFSYLFLTFLSTFVITFLVMPFIIKKMHNANLVGNDVNKLNKPPVPEMGGLAGVIGLSLGLSFSFGIIKFFYSLETLPLLVIISVLGISSFVGILDDVAILIRKEKAWFIAFSSLPLIISNLYVTKLDFIFIEINFDNSYLELFFLFLVIPLGVSGCANALNMSAGYNGLESGHVSIISFSLLIISLINNIEIKYIMIFAGIFGSSVALFYFNKYPSKVFIGDIGTLSFGAVIATAIIMTDQIVYGLICIFPAYFELYSTLKYKYLGIERRHACMNPNIDGEGFLSPPEGSEDYSLAYFILNIQSMKEPKLVGYVLFLYILSGFFAVGLALLY